MSTPRKDRVAFKPTLEGTLEDRVAAAHVPGFRAAMVSALLAHRQAAFQTRLASRAWRPITQSPSRPTLQAYQPNGPIYEIAQGPTDNPLGELNNYFIRR